MGKIEEKEWKWSGFVEGDDKSVEWSFIEIWEYNVDNRTVKQEFKITQQILIGKVTKNAAEVRKDKKTVWKDKKL